MSDETTTEDAARSAAPSRTRGLMPPWRKGQSGNPGGVPRGKAKLQAGYINDLAAYWEAHGPAVIEAAALDDPAGFLRVVASLMPKDVTISARPFAELTDDDLLRAVAVLERAVAAGAGALDLGPAIEGEAARLLPSLPEAAGVPRGGEGAPGAAADGGEPSGEDVERLG